jgi:hypothetical protein
MGKLDNLSAADVKDARSIHESLVKLNDKLATHFIYYYSWFWAISSTLYFFCVTFINMPLGGQHFADVILGFLLGTAVATIIGFFYGNSSSGGSADGGS